MQNQQVQNILKTPVVENTLSTPDSQLRKTALQLVGKTMRLQSDRNGVRLSDLREHVRAAVIQYAVEKHFFKASDSLEKSKYTEKLVPRYQASDEGANQWFKQALELENATSDLEEHLYALVADDLDELDLGDKKSLDWTERVNLATRDMTFMESETALMKCIAGWCATFPELAKALLARDMMHRRDYPAIRNADADDDEWQRVTADRFMITAYVHDVETAFVLGAAKATLIEAQDALAEVLWARIREKMAALEKSEEKVAAAESLSPPPPSEPRPHEIQVTKLTDFKSALETRKLTSLALDLYQLLEVEKTTTVELAVTDAVVSSSMTPTQGEVRWILTTFVELGLASRTNEDYERKEGAMDLLELTRVLQAI